MTSASVEDADGQHRGRGLRGRLPMAGVVLACVTAVVVAVSGAATSVPALRFLPPGHWVFNASLQSVFHVDGATASVDAVAENVPGSAGSLVVQGDTSGFVVGDSRITQFGKSSLEVTAQYDVPSDENPIQVAVAGDPYLVYPESGSVVRLGDGAQVIKAGSSLGYPVATSDGTLWLPRLSASLLCQLAPGADRVTCPVRLPKGHAGAMSVVDDKAVFVDTAADVVRTVETDGLGDPRALGIDVSDGSRVAATDVSGRLVILDQKAHQMHLVDTTGATEPVHVAMPGDSYDGPVANGSVIAVVDRKAGTLNTFDTDGAAREQTPLPQESGTPRITRGEDDRMYVDGAEGEHVLVVDRDGSVAEVPVVVDGRPSSTEADEDRRKDGEVPAGPPQQGPPQGQQPPVSQQPPPKPPARNAPPNTDPPVVPASAPGAPVGLQASRGDGSAAVSWGAAPDNRAPITAYTISWPGGQTTALGTARSVTIPGLANGTSYVFTVTATNAAGTGPGVSSNPVVPAPPFHAASEPLNLSGDNDTANTTISANWEVPADMGTGTFVHYLIDIVGVRQATNADQSISYTDLQVDGEVTINVTAVTQSPDGQQVPGATATVVTGQSGGGAEEVRLTRGPDTDQWCGPDPACAWMHVELIGLAPNTAYDLMPDSTDTLYENPGYTITTDDSGYGVTDQFAYHGVGNTVWVTATSQADGSVTRSNDLPWEAG